MFLSSRRLLSCLIPLRSPVSFSHICSDFFFKKKLPPSLRVERGPRTHQKGGARFRAEPPLHLSSHCPTTAFRVISTRCRRALPPYPPPTHPPILAAHTRTVSLLIPGVSLVHTHYYRLRLGRAVKKKTRRRALRKATEALFSAPPQPKSTKPSE